MELQVRGPLKAVRGIGHPLRIGQFQDGVAHDLSCGLGTELEIIEPCGRDDRELCKNVFVKISALDFLPRCKITEYVAKIAKQ